MGETTATYTRCLMNEFVTTKNKLNKNRSSGGAA
jgi:hypothetical protein